MRTIKLALIVALPLAACSTAEPFRRGVAWGEALTETAAVGACLRAYQYDEDALAACLDGVGAGMP